MINQRVNNGISTRFKWVMIVYTLFIIGMVSYIIGDDFLNYAVSPTIRTYHDNLFFPLWILMVGYEIGVKRTTKRLTARWKN